MLSKCEIHNVDGSTVYSVDSDPVSTGFSALTKFQPDVENRNIVDRGRMQARGRWPTFPYEGGMSIDIEGTLQADTPAHVLAQLDLLTIALRGLPATAITARRHGTLVIRRLDKTEDWKTDFQVMAFSAPITADSTIITYMITLYSFVPWFVGTTSATEFFWT